MRTGFIFADNAATTRISDNTLEAMLPFLREQYGNASSQYSHGMNAKRAIELAREQIAGVVGSRQDEIIFTSSGTEANNMVLRSIADIYRRENAHIITTVIEHPSVFNVCRALEGIGVEVTYLPVDSLGRVSVDSVVAALKHNTRLVSIMMANNEVGTIQPIAEIGRLLKERGVFFHSDAVQAIGHIPVDVSNLHVDFLTASAHKFNGAKGTGIIYIRSGVELPPLLFGGGQEMEFRAGTENVAGIVAAGYALEESVANMSETAERISTMAFTTINAIRSRVPNMRVNGDYENNLPGLINLGFDGVSGESLMHLLDLKGICVSTSSACNAGKDEPSHVLLALGQTAQQAKSAIRISYGRFNADNDAEIIAAAVCDAYEKICKTSSIDNSSHSFAISQPTVSYSSSNTEKADLFMSLFRGREDVYARRWESKDGQKSGYSPVCSNEWARGVCEKPRVKCAVCMHRELVPFEKQVIERHLKGKK